MKLKEYSKYIQKLAKKYPNLECYYASNDESFRKVYLRPIVMNFDIESGYPNDTSKDLVIIIN